MSLVELARERAHERNLAKLSERMREHRFKLAARGLCINGANHGPPEPGKTKCTACLVVHRKSNKRKPYLSRTDGL